MSETRVILVDDHAVLRSGLRYLLEREPDLEVVGEAGDGEEAVGLARDLEPDVIVLDLSMPGLGGTKTIRALRDVSPTSRILVLTMHADSSYLRSAFRAGAVGYIPKMAIDAELISAIHTVSRGDNYVHPTMTDGLVKAMVPPELAALRGKSRAWEGLSDREREVLRLVAFGHTNHEIASQLSLSEKTIETYRSRGMAKLGVRSRAGLVRYSLEHDLMSD
jgi:two-component system response regulator NreC